jgi:hypothetical protein
MEETVLYRRSPIMVKTIPKGTLLFRISKDQKSDTHGVLLDNGTRCITPTYNVFFHPNPFVGHYIYKKYEHEIGNRLHIYVLKHDVKVILLLNPSKYNRLDYKKGTFIKPCSTMRKGCMPKKGKPYDPCFSPTFIKQNPDIVGMIANSAGDIKLMKKATIPQKISKTFRKAKDSFGIETVPELILHPLKSRSSTNVIAKDGDSLDTNYELLRSSVYNEREMRDFMDKHAIYNPETYFYTYKQ